MMHPKSKLLKAIFMSIQKLNFQILEGEFTIHRLKPDHPVPSQVYNSPMLSITKTKDELSIVLNSSIPVRSDVCEDGWSCMKIIGPLDFSLTGILAGISAVLAKADISIFAISTYDTDYILVKTRLLGQAQKNLVEAGHHFTD